MSAQGDLIVGQAALGVDVPERAHPVDDEAVVFDRSLETLEAVPCGANKPPSATPDARARATITHAKRRGLTRHVLQDDPRALGDEDEVREAVHDDRALALLDRVREHRERGRERAVPAREDVDVRALRPRDVRRVDRGLDLGAVEVDGRLRLEERAREAEHVPQDRPGVEDAVDVERGVHEQRRVEDQVPDVAPAVRLDALAGQGEEALGREGDVLLDVPGVVAGLRDGVEVREEGIAASAQLEHTMTSWIDRRT